MEIHIYERRVEMHLMKQLLDITFLVVFCCKNHFFLNFVKIVQCFGTGHYSRKTYHKKKVIGDTLCFVIQPLDEPAPLFEMMQNMAKCENMYWPGPRLIETSAITQTFCYVYCLLNSFHFSIYKLDVF